MKSKSLIDNSIELFYNSTNEDTRLQNGLGPLEFERNKELILRYIPNHQSVIADIGGGTGHYSKWLSELGHNVHLFDPVQKHVHLAKQKASKGSFFNSHLGSAQNVNLENESVDVVILHGPLYHLQEEEDRIIAILEAKRILRPNGIILAFAINFTASTFAALINGFIHDPEIFNMCVGELTNGLHNPPEKIAGMLPKAFYHKPGELIYEFEKAGFTLLDLVGVETCVWLEKNYYKSRGDNALWNNLKQLIKLLEREPSLMGLSPHFMIAARKY